MLIHNILPPPANSIHKLLNYVKGAEATNSTHNFRSGNQEYTTPPQNIVGLQLLKLIASFLIVNIHITSFYYPYFIYIARIGVPIFLLITGYFLCDSNGLISKDKIKNSLRKIASMFIWANVPYIILKIYANKDSILNDGLQCIDYKTIFSSLLNIIFVGDELCVAFWYINALIYSFILILILVENNFLKYIWFFIPFGLILNYVIGELGFLDFDGNNLLYFHRNFLTISLPCLITGFYLKKHSSKLPCIRFYYFPILLILLIIELVVIKSWRGVIVGDIQIMTIPIAVFAFLWFKDLKCGKFGVIISELGRKYSRDIYLYHILIYYIICISIGSSISGMAIIVFFVSLLFAVFIRKLKECKQYILNKRTIIEGV